MSAATEAGEAVSADAALRRRRRSFTIRDEDHGVTLRFGDLDGIVFEGGIDECVAANLELWLNRMLSSDREAQDFLRPTAPGDDVEALRAEVVAPDDLTSREFGRNLFRAVIGESYKPHVWGNHRALHHTSVRFALDMADRSMPEVADVLRALIWQQVIVDNRARHASEARRAAEDRATAAEAALAKARADALEEAAKIADQHWDGMVVPEARGASEVAAAIRALTLTDGGQKHGD